MEAAEGLRGAEGREQAADNPFQGDIRRLEEELCMTQRSKIPKHMLHCLAGFTYTT